ncbi:MAG: shikimate dehydrogenase family protein [Bacteroidia bacterium]
MKKFGLIGSNLTNTFSKKFFEEKFLSLNLKDHAFENYSLGNIDELETLLKDEELCGLMVTVPYKMEVIKFLNELDETAREVGAVNCVKIVDRSKIIDHSLPSNAKSQTAKKLIGYNTDVIGFENSLKPFIQNFKGKALILGTGGAAKAVAFVLLKLKIDCTFVSRNPKSENEISYTSLSKKIIEEHQLIINCTSVGMFPDISESPGIPYEFISNNHFIYDLIYLPEETFFLKNCKAKGAKTKNGMEMLQLQAEEGLRIFLD